MIQVFAAFSSVLVYSFNNFILVENSCTWQLIMPSFPSDFVSLLERFNTKSMKLTQNTQYFLFHLTVHFSWPYCLIYCMYSVLVGMLYNKNTPGGLYNKTVISYSRLGSPRLRCRKIFHVWWEPPLPGLQTAGHLLAVLSCGGERKRSKLSCLS